MADDTTHLRVIAARAVCVGCTPCACSHHCFAFDCLHRPSHEKTAPAHAFSVSFVLLCLQSILVLLLNPCALVLQVMSYGGCRQVTVDCNWLNVAQELGVQTHGDVDLLCQLRTCYQDFLLRFERMTLPQWKDLTGRLVGACV